MGFVADRVRETTSTTGTGNITLSGAVTGFQAFSAVATVNGQEFFYCIQGPTTEWEVGSGYLSGSTTLVRRLVYSSSNSNALVSFSAGVKDVFMTFPAIQLTTTGFNLAMKNNLAGN